MEGRTVGFGIAAAGLVAGGGGLLVYFIARRNAVPEGGTRTGDEPSPPPLPLADIYTPALVPGAGVKVVPNDVYTPADVEAVASALNSEASSQKDSERRAIVYAMRNYARRVKRPIAQIAPAGAGGQGGKQPWATSKPARDKDREDAARYLAGAIADDPANGAHMFFEPGAQDKILRLANLYREDPVKNAKYANLNKYKRGAEEIRQKWTREGNALTATVGRWEFYGHPRTAVVGFGGGIDVLGALT